jgi:hypothetical protein
MSITTTLAKVPTAVADNNLDISVLDKTKLKLRSVTQSADKLVLIADYVYADGNPDHEVSVIIRFATDKSSGLKRKQRISARLATPVLSADSVSGLTSVGDDAEGFVALNIPVGSAIDTSDLLLLLYSTVSLLLGAISSGAADESIIDALRNGIVSIY